ncbi:helix-turn-helix domain-containing protein [Paenibacillus sp. FA6]|uniref:helix-turn-helix domain-containing protein n=1 Tax=Paenibacillus sp. FA6 TaxID=3413029 RepID=UPI003F65804A
MDDLTIESYDLQNNIFRIRYVNEKSYTEMRSTHFHDGFELYYLLRGEKLFFVNDQLFHAGKGDLVIIHPYDAHKTSSVKDVEAERIVVHFKEEFIERQIGMENFNLAYLKELPYKIHLTVQEQMQVERILNEILKECEMKGEQHGLYIKSSLSMLLIAIHRHGLNENVAQEEIISLVDRNMLNIASYINTNYSTKLSLNSIANEFYISPSYLSRAFKNVTGFNISRYIQLVRIREAQKLLKETNFRIIDVAGLVGFTQIAHFNKVFKKITNLSPLKYRKNGK